jgi:hypothetical protein
MQTNAKTALSTLLSSLLLCASGTAHSEWQRPGVQMPTWLSERLAPDKRGLVAPVEVWQLGPQERPAYLFVSPCCDMGNKVYGQSGELVCIAGGGISPKGMRPCHELAIKFDERVLIWSLNRPSADKKTDDPQAGPVEALKRLFQGRNP